MTNVVQILINTPLALSGDYWVSRNHFSLLTWRRLAQAVGSYIPSLALVWLAFVSSEQRILAIALLYVYSGIDAVLIFGSLVNHVDISPRYAGVLMSIENTIAQCLAMFAPLVTQYVVSDSVSFCYNNSGATKIIVMNLCRRRTCYFGDGCFYHWLLL